MSDWRLVSVQWKRRCIPASRWRTQITDCPQKDYQEGYVEACRWNFRGWGRIQFTPLDRAKYSVVSKWLQLSVCWVTFQDSAVELCCQRFLWGLLNPNWWEDDITGGNLIFLWWKLSQQTQDQNNISINENYWLLNCRTGNGNSIRKRSLKIEVQTLVALYANHEDKSRVIPGRMSN